MGKETPFYLPTSEEEMAKFARKEDERKLTAKLEKSVQDFKAQQEKKKNINPEALAAVKELDEQQLESLRKKLAGLDVGGQQFADGTGAHEKLEDMTGDVEEIDETKN